MSYPKELHANMRWRHKLMVACDNDDNLRSQVHEQCRRDILFWLNFAAFTYDPRANEGQREIPFITWPYQDTTILSLQASLGKEDVVIEKSRDMGASWLILALFAHQWLFRGMSALGVASDTETLVDSTENPDCLFWKLRYLIYNQPEWLQPQPQPLDQKLLLKNHQTKSTIKGYATSDDIARGGRLLALLIDEYAAYEIPKGYAVDASSHGATNCRIWNSTYKGASGCFYDKASADPPVCKKISLPWTLHPHKSIGMYQDVNGKTRSPWYDEACKRLSIPGLIASELDMDPVGAAGPFFPSDLLRRLIELDARPPYLTGRLERNQRDGVGQFVFVSDEK